jgi:hypothetical protein
MKPFIFIYGKNEDNIPEIFIESIAVKSNPPQDLYKLKPIKPEEDPDLFRAYPHYSSRKYPSNPFLHKKFFIYVREGIDRFDYERCLKNLSEAVGEPI